MKGCLQILLINSLLSVTVNALAYGALAIDSNLGNAYGFAFDYPSATQAESRALIECGSHCHIIKTFEFGCAAYAVDKTKNSDIFGWSIAETEVAAKEAALTTCRDYGGKECVVRVWSCNSSS